MSPGGTGINFGGTVNSAETASLDAVAVVIPVHNEEQHVVRALEAVRAAVDFLKARRPGIDARVMVVLDACTDNSGFLARRFAAADPRFIVMDAAFRCVGKSRRAGIEALWDGPCDAGSAVPASRLWLANTDADSCVPRNWLVRQVALADAGADVVLGSVEPDAEGMDPDLVRRWHFRHPLGEDHPHVFGANLGVRADAYVATGGFPAVDSGEDRLLVTRLRRGGARILATDSTRVLTSGRTEARAPRGFAGYLLSLTREPAVLEPAVLEG